MNELKRTLFDTKQLLIWVLSLFALCTAFVYTERTQSGNTSETITYYQSLIEEYQDNCTAEAADELSRLHDENSVWLGIYHMAKRYPERAQLLNSTSYEVYLHTAPEQLAAWETGEVLLNEESLPSITGTMEAADAVRTQIEYLLYYPQYLEQIQQNAQDMNESSIFRSNPFSRRNIQKTAADYPLQLDIHLELVPEKGITAFFSFSYTDYFLLIWQALFCLKLVDERKKGLHDIIFATAKGRTPLYLQKLSALLLFSIMTTFFTYTALLTLSANTLGGLGDLSRAVQSNPIFQQFPLQLSVRSFLIYQFLVKAGSLFLIGCCFFLLCMVNRSLKISLALFCGTISFEYILYTYISEQSIFAFFKYINIFSYIQTFNLLTRYYNLNLFQYPVSLQIVIFILMLVLLLFLYMMIIRCQFSQKPVKAMTTRLFPSFHKLIPISEFRKVMIKQKGAVFILFFITGAVLFIDEPSLPYQTGGNIYDYYWNQVSDMEIGEARTRLQEELNTLETEMAEISADRNQTPEIEMKLRETEQRLSALSALSAEADRIQSLSDGGFNVALLQTKPYEALLTFEHQHSNSVLAIFQLGLLILTLSGLFAYENENHMTSILRCTYYGRGLLWKRKCALMLTTDVLVWGFANGYILVKTVIAYGPLQGLTMDLQSLQQFASVSFHISILTYLVLMYLLRLTGIIIDGLGISLVSLYCNRTGVAIVINCIVWLVPIALEILTETSMSFLEFISLSGFFLPPTMESIRLNWISFGGFGLLFVFCSWKKWNCISGRDSVLF